MNEFGFVEHVEINWSTKLLEEEGASGGCEPYEILNHTQVEVGSKWSMVLATMWESVSK